MKTPLLALLLACAVGAWAQAPAAAAASAPASAASAPAPNPHSGPEHTARIRSAHFTRLQERLGAAPGQLRETCRFESEVTTLPPPGRVALTFDDGPEPGHTEQIIEVLARHKVPATFFVIAEKAQRHADLLALQRGLPGARVGSHSWSHPNFHQIDADAQRREIDHADEALAGHLLPAEAPAKLFRYPYGNSSCEGNQRLRERGFRIVGWHIDSCDWAFDGDGSVTLHEALSCGVLPAFRRDFLGHVLAQLRAHRGGIVLLHETHRITVQQLDSLVQRLQDEGYSFGVPDDPAFEADLR